MSVTVERLSGGTYNGSGAQPNSTVAAAGIFTDGANRLIVIICISGRDNNVADINQVTAITASGLTFTRIFHDASWTFSDSIGDASFPVASFSVDIFTAPAASTQSGTAWSGTMSGDNFVNHGACWEFALAGLHDINAPFDPNVLTPITEKNASGTSSTLEVSGLTTTNANDLLVAFFANHNPTADATPVAGTGWTLLSGGSIANAGGASGHHSFVQTKSVNATQSGVTVPTGYSDKYWYGVALAFTSDGAAAPAVPGKMLVIT